MTAPEPSRRPGGGARQGTCPASEPWFQVVAGRPSDEELAALTVALATVAADRERESRELTSARGARAARRWASRPQLLRTPLTRGPGAWRRSTRPC
jgi:Acyl-CoA carboxylase epsilon subunit